MNHDKDTRIWRMFDRIAPRYDLLNRLLSGRRDVAWRRALVRELPGKPGLRALDIATGTGDVLLAAVKARPDATMLVGADPAARMLALGKEKLEQTRQSTAVALLQADATRLPCADASFEAVTCAFGIRNVTDYPAALKEMYRVLRPDGRVLILEFAMPTNPAFRIAYLLYFRHILPRLGAWLSRDRAAYRYLNQSVEAFPSGAAFCAALKAAGFSNVRARPLTWGIAALYSGEKE